MCDVLTVKLSSPNHSPGFASWAEVTNMVFNLTLAVDSVGKVPRTDLENLHYFAQSNSSFECAEPLLLYQVSYTFARVYSCLGFGLYSLQILSRVPHVPWADIQTMLAEVLNACFVWRHNHDGADFAIQRVLRSGRVILFRLKCVFEFIMDTQVRAIGIDTSKVRAIDKC